MRTMKLPVPTKGSRMWTPLSPSRAAEFFLQNFLDAANHEVDDRLRRIDNAVGIGFFGRVSLEEALIDFVKEGLLLRKIGGFLGAALDGAIEAFKVAKEIITVQRSLGQFGDHFFNFGGNHVAASEIRIIENVAEDTFGEQMLHQHALDRLLRQVGIDGLLAECVEIFEAADESRIAFLLLVNSLGNGGGEFRNALGEITDSFFPLLDVGSLVIKELVDDGNQGFGAGNVLVGNARTTLIKDGALGVLEV